MNKWMKRMLLVMDICSAFIATATIVINAKGAKEREGKKFFAWEQGVCLLLDGFVLGAVMQRLACCLDELGAKAKEKEKKKLSAKGEEGGEEAGKEEA